MPLLPPLSDALQGGERFVIQRLLLLARSFAERGAVLRMLPRHAALWMICLGVSLPQDRSRVVQFLIPGKVS
ncbi:hypothetical protein XI03_07755 [Bradyrhizobium sp. CCBAU 65884]|nr:hypothetical protein [Bradyrhizobium sp. CCBAU 65884]